MDDILNNVLNGGPITWWLVLVLGYGVYVGLTENYPFVEKREEMDLFTWCLTFALVVFPFAFGFGAFVIIVLFGDILGFDVRG